MEAGRGWEATTVRNLGGMDRGGREGVVGAVTVELFRWQS